ncbi:DUF2085 domain-containing protein [Methanocella conradii]|uniref:DUF2085 domain-containing protein n=1 Tax=Methanocella conradii TaxID=1175444 RepID=UPI00157D9C4C|nr:DUF2085 domain-containing protein [Methanocella conradii]
MDIKKALFDVIIVIYMVIAAAVFVPWILFSILGPAPLAIAISDAIFRFFSLFCHQLPWRSLFFNGIQMPVCARCASIYVATALGLAFFRLKGYGGREFRMNWPLLILLFVPTGVDGFTQYLGLRESTNLLRLITGFPYGLGYAYLLAWAVPFTWALLELVATAMRGDGENAKVVLQRIKSMAWPFTRGARSPPRSS